MDENRVKGKIDEVAGRVKKQTGEWTGDTEAQGEGAFEEIKGRAENAWGKVKDTARKAKRDMDRKDRDKDIDRESEAA
jgi:uncharacterized protein YjbJ (UPF0337 family)